MAILFPSAPAEFVSDYSLEESIERLKAVVYGSVLQVLFQEAAVGRVSKRRVSIQRMIPLIGNSFKPVFTGKFDTRSGQVVLTGAFAIQRFTRVWIAMGLFMAAMNGLIVLGKGSPNSGLTFLAIAGIAGLGVGIVRLCNWLSRHDVAWLSSLISQALSTEGTGDMAREPSWMGADRGDDSDLRDGADAGALPCVPTKSSEASMAAFKVLLLICELAVLASAVTGVRAIRTAQGRGLVSIEHDAQSRLEAFLLAGVVAVFLYGLHVRAPLAWKAGWGLLVLLIVGGIANATDSSAMNPLIAPRESPLFFIIGGGAVGVFLGLWWKNQRDYFRGKTYESTS
ncbi:MAG TPA: hypothetical protein VNX28_16490 [Gemmataceae bacterium]|jgi:hypothetical protein|nr:hypothetical protein [Gemmataceae bacterium]